MNKNTSLTTYMNTAIEKLVSDILRTSFKNPRETAFLFCAKKHIRQSFKKREQAEKTGRHIPPFLIASITETCNLRCKGCYARANGSCGDEQKSDRTLTPAEWTRIFKESDNLGVSFTLLAGGEPLMRPDILEAAAKIKNMIYPVFTNGTLIDAAATRFFDKRRNLIPILSIEGDRLSTDTRRGNGVYIKLISTMALLQQKDILFGASITVTKENLHTVTTQDFIDSLHERGCRLLFFVEYVPMEKGTEHLALEAPERLVLDGRQQALRKAFPSMIFLSFPGDEKQMGGCLAAGRGFFHINAKGDAEACPFSPHSDRNLRTHSLKEVLESPFFKKLQEETLLEEDHSGGCALFEKREWVEKVMAEHCESV
ncbi:MAG: radical SAM protein, partial [Eubacterium sp.]